MPRSEISLEMRKLVITFHQESKSVREIEQLTGIKRSTVQNIIKRYRESGSVENRKRTGRPRQISARTERKLVAEVKKNPKCTALSLLQNINVTVHPQTIRRVLHKNNFRCRTPRKKPFISDANKAKRLQFAKEHENQPIEFWKSIVFSDESKFNIFGSDGRQGVWRRPGTAIQPENLVPTVKHGGGSVMVWGCMSYSGVGNLVFIDGIMNKEKYVAILKENLKSSVERLGLPDTWIFQHDRDPKHTSYLAKEWLLYNSPKQLNSPPQSPDLNPIEHLWEILERKVRKHKISNKNELKTVLLLEWNKINSSNTQPLVDSMPRRLKEVLKSKGGPTKY